MDADHKKLIAIINKVVEATEKQSSLRDVLDDLDYYVQYHFSREEERMVEAGYPEFIEHKKKHVEFVEWLGNLKITYSLSPEASIQMAATVNEFLCEWLVEHILKVDKAYQGKI